MSREPFPEQNIISFSTVVQFVEQDHVTAISQSPQWVGKPSIPASSNSSFAQYQKTKAISCAVLICENGWLRFWFCFPSLANARMRWFLHDWKNEWWWWGMFCLSAVLGYYWEQMGATRSLIDSVKGLAGFQGWGWSLKIRCCLGILNSFRYDRHIKSWFSSFIDLMNYFSDFFRLSHPLCTLEIFSK
jgi:hypothetical protein